MPRPPSILLLAALACAPPPPAPPAPEVPPEAPPAPPPIPWSVAAEGPALRFVGPDAEVRASARVLVRQAGLALASASITSWKVEDGALVGAAVAGGVAWEVRLVGGEPLRVDVVASHTEAATVDLLALELDFPGVAAEVLDRAYRRVAPGAAIDVGWGTPRIAWLGPLVLRTGADGLRVERRDDGARVRIVLDEAARHPLHLWSACVDRADELPAKTDRSARVVVAGEVRAAAITLTADAKMPVPTRFPAPYRAALAFTDHADQADAARLGALMYGRATAADPLAARGAGQGFAGRGLSMTKTVFPLRARPYPPQLDDPAFVALVDALHADGIELGPHSASGAPDPTARTVEGLALLRRFEPRTWIDHQPNTNCEAVTNRGLLDGPHAVRAALEAEGYRYLWSGYDLPEDGSRLNLFAPEAPAAIRPVVHPHPLAGEALWFFHSQWRTWARPRFLAAYTDEALDALIAERGLHVAHTYLDTYRDRGPLAPWTLLEPIDGGFALRPEADAMFARLQVRQDRAELLVTGIGPLADHLRAVEGLGWAVRGGALHLDAPAPVAALGVLLPEGTTAARVGDAPGRIVGDLLVIDALPAGTTVVTFDPPLGPAVAWTVGGG